MKQENTLLKKNQRIELDITATGSQGEGIGRYEGMAVFVPAAAQGDKIEAHIVKAQKNMAFARIANIIEPSTDRVESDCAAFPKCGGCVFRHISYEAERRAKLQRVADAMRRIGGVELEPERILAAEMPDRYRNKAQLPCQRLEDGSVGFGFYAQRSHRIVTCADCRLQPEGFAQITAAVAEFMEENGVEPYDEQTGKGTVRHLYMRASRTTGAIAVCLVINADRIKNEEKLVEAIRKASDRVTGVVVNINKKQTNVILGERCRTLWGEPTITEKLLGVEFRVSPQSFFQVNPAQTERLYAKAAEYAGLTGDETVLDMYCGGGAIGMTMATKAKQIIGVEVCAEAVEDAKANAAHNEIANAEYICADAAQAAKQLAQRGIKPDVVILDPPRKGCEQSLIETVANMDPDRIVYVSCDPATLARDVKLFAALGYNVKKYTAVDMFPRTMHVETVVQLSREHIDDRIKIDIDVAALQGNTGATASYEDIKAYVLEHSGLKVSSLYIAQVKEKYGLKERVCYNKPKSENARQPKCPEDKEKAIVEALRFFGMIK